MPHWLISFERNTNLFFLTHSSFVFWLAKQQRKGMLRGKGNFTEKWGQWEPHLHSHA